MDSALTFPWQDELSHAVAIETGLYDWSVVSLLKCIFYRHLVKVSMVPSSYE